VGAVSGSGPFYGDGYAVTATALAESMDIPLPFSLVEIRREEPTAIVSQHWVNAHDERAAVRACSPKMALDRRVIDADEGLI
jgi:hypothetical protein